MIHFSANQELGRDTKQRLQQSIRHHTAFSIDEKTRLHHYLLRRIYTLESMHEVRDELARLALDKKRRVRHILLSIVFADQNYTELQQQSLEKLYLSLGLSKRLLMGDISTFSTNNTIAKHHHNHITIPAHQSSLKLHAVKQANTTTKQDEHVLSATFTEDNKQQNKQTTTQTSPSSEMVTATYGQQSLSDKRDRLYKHLILQHRWTQQAFKRLCKYYKLSPVGAIEIINKWAKQQVNTAVLSQQGNVVIVNTDVVAKIQ